MKVHNLTNEELEKCIDGSTNLALIRLILTKHTVVGNDGFIDPEIFADWFSIGICGYITEDVDSKEWNEANDNNWNWGYDIADNINMLLLDGENKIEHNL